MHVCASTDGRRRVGGCWNESVLLNIFYSYFWPGYFNVLYSALLHCRHSDSPVSEDAGIEPVTVVTLHGIDIQTHYNLAKYHPRLG